MTKKRRTRRALINSVISLLICFSMLLGTTFAWFTDEVKTGMNTIAAGNLDVELVHSNAKVTDESVAGATDLFYGLNGEEILWEPGVVAYENLQVKNVGTLALKYQMTLNIADENNLNGHKLSEVLKVAVLDKEIAAGADRIKVLEDAKKALVDAKNDGSLNNFFMNGALEAGKSSEAQAVVIFWEPNANEIDNLYNANNGQETSDKKPLHIKFGVNLQATQKMSEEDSFGKDYDEFAKLLPKATINDLGKHGINATLNGWGSSAVVNKYVLDSAYQFLPNESAEEVKSNAYKYYNVDFVISADKDVAANSMMVAGYYNAFCDAINNDNWVALTAGEKIEAGTEIRLVNTMSEAMGHAIKVSYKDICDWGNDGTGFLCGIKDMDGTNAGTTVTVELRMYETTSDPNSSSNTGVEVGSENYFVVGKYNYTFGAYKVDTAGELAKILTSDVENIDVVLAEDIDLPITSLGAQASGSGEYKLGGANTENININLNGHKLNITTTYWSAIGANNPNATITIKNGSMTSTGNTAETWNAWDVRLSNCNYVIEDVTFDKAVALDNAGKKTAMNNVVINENSGDKYALWITAEGQDVAIDGLTINSTGRGIKIDEQYVDTPAKVTLSVSNAEFTTVKKAAIMVKSAAGADITVNNVDLSGVAVDKTNAVWVDEDAKTHADLVTVTGGSKFVEGTV